MCSLGHGPLQINPDQPRPQTARPEVYMPHPLRYKENENSLAKGSPDESNLNTGETNHNLPPLQYKWRYHMFGTWDDALAERERERSSYP